MMARMAVAVCKGGASGIRANGVEDIKAIQREVDVPIIGLIKRNYPESDVYITPTISEVDALAQTGVDIIAMDATGRVRPDGNTLRTFFTQVRHKYPDLLFMADTSCFEEGLLAQELGFDIVGTTLSGYTENTAHRALPDLELMRQYVHYLNVPIFAEGGIRSPAQLREVMETGVFAAVIGSAITRPMQITSMFTAVLE